MVFPQLLNRYIGLKLLGDKGKADNLAQDPEVQKLMSDYETEAVRQVFVTRYLNEHVTEDAIKARYEQKLKDNPPPEEVRAAHILVKTEDEAKAIIEQLKGGADFAAARQGEVDRQGQRRQRRRARLVLQGSDGEGIRRRRLRDEGG